MTVLLRRQWNQCAVWK